MTADAPLELTLLPSPPGAEAYLAVLKPAGPTSGEVLLEARRRFGDDLHLVHRLDRPTTGVLLFARGLDALREAHEAWPDRVTKTYLARTRGVPKPPEGTVDAPLLENRSGKPELLRRALRAAYGPTRAGLLAAGHRVLAIPVVPPPGRTAVHPAGREAQTDYRVIREEEGGALVEARPRQGRMHQIRVHLEHVGAPVRNDWLYDVDAEPGQPLFLQATRLEWRRPDGAVWVWEAGL